MATCTAATRMPPALSVSSGTARAIQVDQPDRHRAEGHAPGCDHCGVGGQTEMQDRKPQSNRADDQRRQCQRQAQAAFHQDAGEYGAGEIGHAKAEQQ